MRFTLLIRDNNKARKRCMRARSAILVQCANGTLHTAELGFFPLQSRAHRLHEVIGTQHKLVASAVVYFVCWCPYVNLVSATSFMPAFQPSPNLQFWTLWLGNCKSFLNVFVYSFIHKSFRQGCSAADTFVVAAGFRRLQQLGAFCGGCVCTHTKKKKIVSYFFPLLFTVMQVYKS